MPFRAPSPGKADSKWRQEGVRSPHATTYAHDGKPARQQRHDEDNGDEARKRLHTFHATFRDVSDTNGADGPTRSRGIFYIMPLAKIQFSPGVNKEGTEYTADALGGLTPTRYGSVKGV